MRKLVCLLLAFALGGCSHFGWVKDGVTQQEASQDTRTCLREAQGRDSGTHANLYGLFGQDAVITDPNQYHVCMAAHGYSWRQMSAAPR